MAVKNGRNGCPSAKRNLRFKNLFSLHGGGGGNCMPKADAMSFKKVSV